MPAARPKGEPFSRVNERASPSSQEVPATLRDAIVAFLRHPTPIGVLAGLFCFGTVRLMSPFTATDVMSESLCFQR